MSSFTNPCLTSLGNAHLLLFQATRPASALQASAFCTGYQRCSPACRVDRLPLRSSHRRVHGHCGPAAGAPGLPVLREEAAREPAAQATSARSERKRCAHWCALPSARAPVRWLPAERSFARRVLLNGAGRVRPPPELHALRANCQHSCPSSQRRDRRARRWMRRPWRSRRTPASAPLPLPRRAVASRLCG